MRNEKDHHLSACKDDLQLIHQASSMLKPHLKTSHIPFAITETESHTHREGCYLKTCKTPFATTERRERERSLQAIPLHCRCDPSAYSRNLLKCLPQLGQARQYRECLVALLRGP
jgi:hypothetical protein